MNGRVNTKTQLYSLKSIIILLVCTVVLIALSCTGLLVAYDYAKSTKSSLEDKVWTIATSFARSPVVIEGLENNLSQERLQEYAEEVQIETDVDYIVVMNMDRIRLTHPTEDQIGRKFVGDDEELAFEGHTYSSVADGTLGESLRSFIPVVNEADEQVGVVAVGILTENINEAVYRSQFMVWLGGILGLIPGILGAVLLASKVKRSMHNLEPSEITHLLETREAMLSSVQEGIIAVDAEGRIILCNTAAAHMLQKAGIKEEPLNQAITTFLPEFKLQEVLQTGEVERIQQVFLGDFELVVNRVPVDANGVRLGAMATFQDTTKLATALNQLSGIKSYAEALRTHTHEFMNKLHVVSAMVHTESYQELQDYIKTISTYYQKDIGWMSRHLKDPILVGYLLNKLTELKSKNIDVQLVGETAWPVIRDPKYMNALITVIGNSLDNAADAVETVASPSIEIVVDVKESRLIWQVKDNGPRLTQEQLEESFAKGRSTKGEGRGYGFYLMQSSLDDVYGQLDVLANQDQGVTLQAKVPLQGVRNDKRINS